MTTPWWKEPFRLFQSNIRLTEAAFDTEAAVALIENLGYDAWLLNAGGIGYFYPVDGEDQTLSPWLAQRPSGDLIADAVDAAHARGIRLVGRFDFSRLPTDTVRRHPEWAHLDVDGDPVTRDGLTSICPRSDFYTERVPEILADFVRRYPVDGVIINWFQYVEISYEFEYLGLCHCERCRTAAAADPAIKVVPDPVKGVGAYGLWRAAAKRELRALAESCDTLIKKERPGTALFLASSPVDIVFLETNGPVGLDTGPRWWEHTPSELASAHRTARPELPAIVHSALNLGFAYRMVGDEPGQFVRYLAQALSRGARPSAVVIGAPTEEHVAALGAGRDVLHLYARHRDLYAWLRPAAKVALLRPGG
ncbi:beta-galactosidase, partial [Streptomyces sp. NPDC006356]